jgi:hypothetical protein
MTRVTWNAMLVAAVACAAVACAVEPADEATSEAPLVAYDVHMWTENASIIPMCWHFFDGFDPYIDKSAMIAAAKQYVKEAIQRYWGDPLNLTISWTNCPTSGSARHVRVMLRIGDASFNGNTVQAGMATLTTPAERAADLANVTPGLLMGFPAWWNDGPLEREAFRALTLHEFGHILGFGHEKDRRDGDPGLDPCYENAEPYSGYDVGELDPTSIMAWSYCVSGGTVTSEGDIEGARSFYGTSPTHFEGLYLWSDWACANNGRCRLADVTGDGRADLIGPTMFLSRPYVYVSPSNGAGFDPPQLWTMFLCGGNELCEFGDVDGDGRADLVAFSRGTSPRVRVARSTGSGFAAETQWSPFACLDGEVCKLADVNADGRDDIVVFTHNGSPAVWVLLAQWPGVFGSPQLWSSYFCTPTEVCDVGDVDRDGRADILAFSHDAGGYVWVARSNGAGFVSTSPWRSGLCFTGEECRVADVSADGRADAIAFGHQAGNAGVQVARASRSAPEFQPPQPWVSLSFCQPEDTCLVGEIDGAWGADVVSVRGTGQVWVKLSSP